MWLAVLLLSAVFDYVYVRYTRAVAAGRVWPAVLLSGSLTVIVLLQTWWFVHDAALAPWIVCGHMLGCWLAMRDAK